MPPARALPLSALWCVFSVPLAARPSACRPARLPEFVHVYLSDDCFCPFVYPTVFVRPWLLHQSLSAPRSVRLSYRPVCLSGSVSAAFSLAQSRAVPQGTPDPTHSGPHSLKWGWGGSPQPPF